jgi:DNA modification methylase
MISDNQLPELRDYRILERELPIVEDPHFGSLVVSSGNEQLAVHRWFRFKEAYSAGLVPALLETYAPAGQTFSLLDPYCGVGTTLLSAQTVSTQSISATGIEYNPFVRFVACTKLDWHLVDPVKLVALGATVAKAGQAERMELPELSGFQTGRCMSIHIARRLIGIRDAIRSEGDSPTHKALLLGLAAAIEPLSHTRKDGRALRLVDRPRQIVSAVLQDKWEAIAADVSSMRILQPHRNAVKIIAGDGRKPLAHGVQPGSVDLIITSPPYPNNIDYSEVYKLELWLLGFIRDSNSFLGLRKQTFRSHPTSDLSTPEEDFLKKITAQPLSQAFEPVLSKLDAKKETWRRRLFVGYFSDTKSALEQYYLSLRPGGHAFIIVGNSLHGGKYAPYLIATDLLIATLARSIGFEVERISVARSLRRRLMGNHFLRESLLVLRKSHGKQQRVSSV